MKETKLIDDYFPDWDFSEDNNEQVIFTHDGKQHKVTVRCGISHPFIIFKGERYYFY